MVFLDNGVLIFFKAIFTTCVDCCNRTNFKMFTDLKLGLCYIDILVQWRLLIMHVKLFEVPISSSSSSKPPRFSTTTGPTARLQRRITTFIPFTMYYLSFHWGSRWSGHTTLVGIKLTKTIVYFFTFKPFERACVQPI